MEIAGFAMGVLGTIGALGQIFDGCIKAYRLFTAASNMGKDSERLLYRVRIEEMRLMVWGRKWGVNDGQLDEKLTPIMAGGHGDMEKTLAEMILTQLYQTIMDSSKLQNKYGLREETPGSVDKEGYKTHALDPKGWSAGLKLRAKWIISDRDKFDLLLSDLQYFNDRLEKLFTPTDMATLQRAWTNELLQVAQRDVDKLRLLESASIGVYPGLNAFAKLKQLRINLDMQEPSKKILSSSELKIQRWRVRVDEHANDEAVRCKAILQKPLNEMRGTVVAEELPVLVEWVKYDADLTLDARLHLYQRVDNLARMLHSSSNRHPDLNTLDCLGYIEDTQKERYGIVYLHVSETPRISEFHSLSSLISTMPSPDLNIRFKLAHTLAVALWSLHSLDWLHKTLCPHNILFFAIDEDGTEDESIGQAKPLNTALSKPYLAGFDSSRPDHLDEMTVASRNDIGQDLYRHPSSLGLSRQPYRKSFDIYSLGLILLEIGLWKSLNVLYKGKYSKSPSAFRDKVIDSIVPTLGAKVGSLYRELVQQCLRFEEAASQDPKYATPHQLLERVVITLETLKV